MSTAKKLTKSRNSKRVKVEITQKEINEAIPRDSGHCMIADAVAAAVPEAKYASVDLQTIRFTLRDEGLRYTYLTPRSAQLALVKFDQGQQDIEPFAFTLQGGAVTKSNPRNGAIGRKSLSERKSDADTGNVPTVIGGHAPPRGALATGGKIAGRRRSFGLRALSL